jgi:membrane protein implicated in regulation of membrane protease activity
VIALLRNVFLFLYEFIFGDDWQVAFGVVAALAVTAGISHDTELPTWWIAVVAVLVLLPLSIYRRTRNRDVPALATDSPDS